MNIGRWSVVVGHSSLAPMRLANDERRMDSGDKKSPGLEARLYGGSQFRTVRVLLLRFQRFDHDELAHGALVHEFDAAADLGEEGVVFATTDVQTWLDPRAPLPNDDGAARDNLSAESLEA
jgi:hypothetical protein